MLTSLPSIDLHNAEKAIVDFIKNFLDSSGMDGIVLGLSGGIDSATVATLCAKAAGPSRVLGLIMPSSTSSRDDINDAKELADGLGISRLVIDISDAQENIAHLYKDNSKLSRIAYGNIAPRLRMTILYLYANNKNLLVVGSSNKSELMVGYFTKYGDGGVDILPIGDLYKTHVKELAKWLNIPQRIIDKKPSAGLWPGQTDEEELGITYRELDLILYALLDMGLSVEKASEVTGLEINKVRKVYQMVTRSEHKRKLPPYPPIKQLLR